MVDFYFSNYTTSSLLYWIDQYRKFDYEISKESINSSAVVGYLRTECGPEDVCAGTLFPGFILYFENQYFMSKLELHGRIANFELVTYLPEKKQFKKQ